MTPEQVVGKRIAMARENRGIGRQEELGAHLADYLGKPWTKQAVSETDRGNRRLNPTELLAFATVLDYPVAMRAETDERVNGLLEITKAEAIGRIRLRSRATGTAVTQTGRGRR
jgi:transcriptional regulator with XRE-family HTH domain